MAAFRKLLATDTFGVSWGYLNDSDEAITTFFAGATAPSPTYPYMTWADTTLGLLRQRNAANDAWIAVGFLGSDYLGLLPRSGGTMTGPIDMGGQTITNLGLATGLGAARAQEVALKAPLVSPAFQTDATLDVDPPTTSSLTRRSWTDSQYLKLAGGTLTGALTLSGDGSSALHPVSKQQFDATLSTTTGHRHDGIDSRVVQAISLGSATIPDNNIIVANGDGTVRWENKAADLDEDEFSVLCGYPSGVYTINITGMPKRIFMPMVKTNHGAASAVVERFGSNGTAYGFTRMYVYYTGTSDENVTVSTRICFLPD